MSVKDLEETYLTPADFETDEHIQQVVQYILQKGPRKTSSGQWFLNRPRPFEILRQPADKWDE